MRFNTNDITLTDARLHLGKSNFTLNGEISQIRKAMLRGGKLKGNFNLNSDYIDCNQLMQAVNNGMQYGENTDLLMLSDRFQGSGIRERGRRDCPARSEYQLEQAQYTIQYGEWEPDNGLPG